MFLIKCVFVVFVCLINNAMLSSSFPLNGFSAISYYDEPSSLCKSIVQPDDVYKNNLTFTGHITVVLKVSAWQINLRQAYLYE